MILLTLQASKNKGATSRRFGRSMVDLKKLELDEIVDGAPEEQLKVRTGVSNSGQLRKSFSIGFGSFRFGGQTPMSKLT